MFSVRQKREISDAVQKILRATGHPELPPDEIRFLLHVDGAESWSWADIRNNGAVSTPGVNPWNEKQDACAEPAKDLEHYDAASVAHLREQSKEYQRTLWALARAAWPNPLRVSQVARDAWDYKSDIQVRTDHATRELLIFAPPLRAEPAKEQP